VLHAEATPSVDTSKWTFMVDGLVESPVTWTWEEIHGLPQSQYKGRSTA
jgi:DMSO/TMAO reductase YedYZ molybdopterin-dependent catalytic subunit